MAAPPLIAVPDAPAEKPTAEAAPYEAGVLAVTGILTTTEVELARMLERAEKARAGVSAEVRLRIRERTASDRMRLAALRHELAGQKTAVDEGFDALLGLLDEADRRLACTDGSGGGVDAALARSVPPPAQGPAANGTAAASPPAQGGEAGAGRTPGKRRWWHRWVRPAA